MSTLAITSNMVGALLLVLAGEVAAQDDSHNHQHGTAAVQEEPAPAAAHNEHEHMAVPAETDQHVHMAVPAETDQHEHMVVPAETEHLQHEHTAPQPVAADEHLHEVMDGHTVDHEQMSEGDTSALRDPHAYADGYERASGPYSLPEQRQVSLADEKTFSGLWMNRLEYVDHEGEDGTEMEGFGWFGNSYRQLIVQAQVEMIDDSVRAGEVDLLYSQAVSPFWDLRMGVHRSFGEETDRDWGAISLKGLAPYWFEIDATLHLGDKGRAAIDLEAEYEILLTQRLVLQPRIDVSAYSKTDAELGRGSGLSTVKFGVRLRYEFDRQFGPYIGVERVSNFGETADMLPTGTDRKETHWILGLRFWF